MPNGNYTLFEGRESILLVADDPYREVIVEGLRWRFVADSHIAFETEGDEREICRLSVKGSTAATDPDYRNAMRTRDLLVQFGAPSLEVEPLVIAPSRGRGMPS